jgi:IS30 family transposase
MKEALSAKMTMFPEQLRRSLTWDSGKELNMGTTAQFAFTGAVLLVAIGCTWAAGIIEAAVGP